MRRVSKIRARRRTAAQQMALVQVKREISATDPHARLKYLHHFRNAFLSYQRVLSAAEIEKRYAESDVLLVGDYHALAASQAFAAALLQTLASQGRPLVLALETVFSHDQRILDRWFKGELSDDALRAALRYDAEWGYDWEPFAALLRQARQLCARVYGIDSGPRGDMRRIGVRDRHAAARIAEIRNELPEARVLALFGEAHLAPQHLPRSLRLCRPQDRILTVLQNVDELYWKAAGELSESVHAVQVYGDVLCVFNSTPLEKYESYRIYIEKWRTQPDTPDLAPTFYNLVDTLLHSLGLEQYSPAAGNHPSALVEEYPEVFAHQEQRIFERVMVERDILAAERALLLERLRAQGCVYLPRQNLLLLERFQMAAAAEEAVRFVQSECRGAASFNGPWAGSSPEHHFYFDVMERALITFGARVLLPQFHVMREGDLYALYSQPREVIEEQMRLRYREFMELVDFLVLHKNIEARGKGLPRLPEIIAGGIILTGRKREFLVSRLGAMLGAQMHEAYLSGALSKSQLRALFFRKIHLPGVAKKTYFELAQKTLRVEPNLPA